ncbi:hypothetical protein D9M68_570630 [compost metagenome]
MVVKLGANAASRFEAIKSSVSAISTVRRSSRPEATISAGPAKAASTPGMVIISPAVPSDTFRPRAMSVSRPMGMNSVDTIAKVPTAMEPTASQAERVGAATASRAGAARSSMQGVLPEEFIMEMLSLNASAMKAPMPVRGHWSVRAGRLATKGRWSSRQFP